jgi:uncharacterized surface protein with fasciclin (FAS1) repeats
VRADDGAAGGEECDKFAPSIYDAIVKAKLTYLQRAVDAAGLTEVLSNSTLQATLLAPSNNAFLDLFDDCDDVLSFDDDGEEERRRKLLDDDDGE